MEMMFKGIKYKYAEDRIYAIAGEKDLPFIIAFCQHSEVGEYIRYFDKYAFHTPDGFWAAYADDLDNCWTF
jgi:hypothetical protein